MSFIENMNIYVYDIEVFKYDWTISFLNHDTNELIVFVNDHKGLLEFYEKNIKTNGILVGYNNKFYDDGILKCLLIGLNPKPLSDYIIEDHNKFWDYLPLKDYRYQFNFLSYDLMEETSIGAPVSLKQFEGVLGWKIYENPIPFDIDRKLNDEEIKIVLEYNEYDVLATNFIFNLFKKKLLSHIEIIEKYDLNPYALKMSAASKTAYVLGASKKLVYDTYNYVLPPSLKNFFDANDEVIKTFENETYQSEKPTLSFDKQMRDFVFHFAQGGGHGAIESFEYEGEIWSLDVKSFYVSIMIAYNFVSRNCNKDAQFIKSLLTNRIKYKNEGNIALADGMKMVLVAIYGSLNFKSGKMYDPQMANNICVTGQILLYLLINKLEPYSKIIQINTDGIFIIPYDKQKCQEIYKQWEIDTKMELELEVGCYIKQKDVNNYVFAKKRYFEWNKTNASKYVKVKGSGVRLSVQRVSDDDFYQLSNYSLGNNRSIVDEAVVRYFVNGEDFKKIIYECDDSVRFMNLVKLNGSFKKLVIKENENYLPLLEKHDYSLIPTNEMLNHKIYRFFSAKNGFNFYKQKETRDTNNELIISYHKVPNVSVNSVIYNGDVKNVKINSLPFVLDYEYYVDFAQKIIDFYENKEGTLSE